MTHRDNNFDAVRLIAAAAVIYGHSYPLTQSASPGFFGNSVQAFAVKIFFVISGYLITISWLSDPRFGRFFLKRSLRIFPALAAVVLLSALVLGPLVTRLPLSEYVRHPGTLGYLWNIALKPVYSLPGVFENLPYPNAVNGSLWTLPVEFLMYCLLPLICGLAVLTRARALPAVATVLACAASTWLIRLQPTPPRWVFFGTDLISVLDIGPYFLLGACVRFYRLERWLSPSIALGVLGTAVLLQPTGIGQELTLYLVAPIAILSFALNAAPGFARAGRFGDFSYGLYLYGFAVQQAVNHFWPGRLTGLQCFALSFPITLIFAVLSWHLLEKQVLRFKPGVPDKRPTPAGPRLSPDGTAARVPGAS